MERYPVARLRSDEPISIPNAGSAAKDDMLVPFQDLCRCEKCNFVILIRVSLIACAFHSSNVRESIVQPNSERNEG